MGRIEFEEDAFSFYPREVEVDAWATELVREAEQTPVEGAFLETMPVTTSFGNNPNTLANRYVMFTRPHGGAFYGYWQPALQARASSD